MIPHRSFPTVKLIKERGYTIINVGALNTICAFSKMGIIVVCKDLGLPIHKTKSEMFFELLKHEKDILNNIKME